jgi:hypothetical protein
MGLLRDRIVQYLDPDFVREHEMALAISKVNQSSVSGVRNRTHRYFRIAPGTGNVTFTVPPASYWILEQVMMFHVTGAAAANSRAAVTAAKASGIPGDPAWEYFVVGFPAVSGADTWYYNLGAFGSKCLSDADGASSQTREVSMSPFLLEPGDTITLVLVNTNDAVFSGHLWITEIT